MTKKTELLKEIFTIIGTMTDECVLRLREDGIFFQMATRDGTTMVTLRFFKSNFNKYDFDKERVIKFNAHLSRDILKKCRKEDTVYISFDSEYANMKYTLTDEKRKKTYELRLLEPDQDELAEPKMPDLEHDVSVISNNKEVLEMLDSLIFVAKGNDSIYVEASEDSFLIKEQDTHGKSTMSLKDFTREGYKKKASTKFGLSLLKPLVTFSSKVADKSLYKVRTEYPLVISSITPDAELTCILAPRVDVE
jgi:DNA polymerase III sliding clamp (beta) subunit (PCNA family)